MEECYHQKTINLRNHKTGHEIINAIKELAEESDYEYEMRVNRGEPRTLKVGFSDRYPYKHVVILTGDRLDRTELQPDGIYSQFAVGSENWGGIRLAVGYDQETVEKAVNKIAGDLEKKLK
jgi:hypothetical protein